MRVINLHAFPEITLNYFSTNSDRLRRFCKKNGIKEGDSVLIVSRSERARILEHKPGFIWVKMIEHNHFLSPLVQALTYCERRMAGSDRQHTRELRTMVLKKIGRRRKHAELVKQRANGRREKRRNGRNGH